MEEVKLGKIVFKEQTDIVISDPCYDIKGCSYGMVFAQLDAGEYTAAVTIDGPDNTKIVLSNNACCDDELEYFNKKLLGKAGVDAGMLGIFVKDKFHGGEGEWHVDLFEQMDEIQAFALEDNGGFVSSSGCGDGEYDVFGYYSDNKLIAIEVIFIEEEELCEKCGDELYHCMCDDYDEYDED